MARIFSSVLRVWALVTVLLLPAVSGATEHYHITFEEPEHHVNAPPALGAGPAKVTSIVFGSPTVVSSPAAAGNQVLEMRAGSTYSQISLNAPTALATRYTLEFDVFTKEMSGSGYGLSILLDAPEVRAISLHGPLRQIYTFNSFTYDGVKSIPFADDTPYHFTVNVDTLANQWTVTVNGTEICRQAFNAVSLYSIRFSVSPTYGNTPVSTTPRAYVDNIRLTDPVVIKPAFTQAPAGRIDSAAPSAIPVVASHANGDALLAWADVASSSVVGVLATPEGTLKGEPFRIPAPGLAAQPRVAALGTGEFVLVWGAADAGGPVTRFHASVISALGVPRPVFGMAQAQAGTSLSGHSVAGNAAGFAAAWLSRPDGASTPLKVWTQRFDAAGVPVSEAVEASAASAAVIGEPVIAVAGASGESTVAWLTGNFTGSTLWRRTFDAAGRPLAAAEAVDSTTVTGGRSLLGLAYDGTEQPVVAWQAYDLFSASTVFYARGFTKAWLSRGGRHTLFSLLGGISRANFAMERGGNFVVAWKQQESGEGSITTRSFNAAFQAVGENEVLATAIWQPNLAPGHAAAMDADQGYWVAWGESERYSPQGTPATVAARKVFRDGKPAVITGSYEPGTLPMVNAVVVTDGENGSVSFTYRLASQPPGAAVRTSASAISGASRFARIAQPLPVNLPPHGTLIYRAEMTASSGTYLGQEHTYTVANGPVIARDDSAHPNLDGSISFDVLSNDSDADGDPLRIVSVTGDAAQGTWSIDPPGLRFVPSASYDGNADATYTVTDSYGSTASAKLRVRNSPVVVQPIAGSTAVVSNGRFAVDLAKFMSDADGDALTISDISAPAAGTATLQGTVLTYEGPLGFQGNIVLTYRVADGHGSSAEGTVTIDAGVSATQVVQASSDPVVGFPNATWRRLGIPSVTRTSGGVYVAGWLATIKEGAELWQGIFSGPIGAPTLRARTGDPVITEAGVVRSERFFQHFLDPVFAGENFAFIARTSGANNLPNTGIWVHSGGELKAVARGGMPSSRADGAAFESFTSLAMPSPDVLFFVARVRVPGQSARLALFSWSAETTPKPGVAQLLAVGDRRLAGALGLRAGSAPAEVTSFDTLEPLAGSPGHGRYAFHPRSGDIPGETPAVNVLARFSSGDQAILTVGPHCHTVITSRTARPGDPFPRFHDFHLPSSAGADGLVALATLRSQADARIVPSIHSFVTGSSIATQGQPAPGTGSRFARLYDPVAAGSVIGFQAALSPAAPGTEEGIWRCDAMGSNPALVARLGDPAASTNGGFFTAFKSLSVAGSRLVFTGEYRLAGERPDHAHLGCWSADGNGTPQLLLGERQVIGGKTVSELTVLTAVPGSAGHSRFASGDLVIARVRFTDGSESIMTLAVP